MARNPHQGDGVTSVEQMVGDGQRAVEQQEVTRWCSAAGQNVEHRPRVAQQVEVRRRAAAPDFAKLEQAQMDGKQLSDERVSGPGDDKAAGVSNLGRSDRACSRHSLKGEGARACAVVRR